MPGTVVAVSVVSEIFKGLSEYFKDPVDGPALAELEARGEIRSETAQRRWIVGQARVAGITFRHATFINEEQAREYWIGLSATQRNTEENTYRALASERMQLIEYIGHVICEGETDGLQGVWVDGVRMPLAENNNPLNVLRDGQFGPADEAFDREPFYGLQYVNNPDLRAVLRGEPKIIRKRVPCISIWQSRGTSSDASLLSSIRRKLINTYSVGDASADEKADAATAQGVGISRTLVRIQQGNVDNSYGPFNRLPQIDYLWKGKGPSSPPGVSGSLLDGNPARAAYWFLTTQMGVEPFLIDEIWKQSSAICDEPFITNAVSVSTAVTPRELLRAANTPTLQILLREIAEELGLPPTAASISPAYAEWKRRRLVRIVERFSGRQFADTSADQRADIVAKWNERFTGSATDADGTRPRYRANGIIPSGADPLKVLSALAKSMAGSIEEHGGIWFIRAGSSSIRPGHVILAEDIVGQRVVQVLEPPLDDQPTTVRASLAQNEVNDYDRYVMPPVSRIEANIGAIDATNVPAFLREAEPFTERVRDLGVFEMVTDPQQADELMRINLYQTRWNTRTITLTVRPGLDFEFFELGKGSPVLLNLPEEDIVGESLGERRESMRCEVAAKPKHYANGNIGLTLVQRDEETYGEKFGIVYDYNDTGDVVLIPDRPTIEVTNPPVCQPFVYNVLRGAVFHTAPEAATRAVRASGGTGRLTFAMDNGADGNILSVFSIDSTTGVVSGRIPAGTVSGQYFGRIVVTDSKGLTGSCEIRITVGTGSRAPVLGIGGHPRRGKPGDQGRARLRVYLPASLGQAFQFITGRFRFWHSDEVPAGWRGTSTVESPNWITIRNTDGEVTWHVPLDAKPGIVEFEAVGLARDGTSVQNKWEFRVLPAVDVNATTFKLWLNTIHVKHGVAMTPTSIIDRQEGADEPISVALAADSVLPSGLSLSSAGVLSGSTTAAAVTHTPTIVGTDSKTPTARTADVQQGLQIVVGAETDSIACTLRAGNQTVKQSASTTIGVRVTGADGAVTATLSSKPKSDWTISDPEFQVRGRPTNFIINVPANQAIGRNPFTVTLRDGSGGTATCSGVLTVTAVTGNPLTLPDVSIEVNKRGAYTSGLRASGGAGSYEYSFDALIGPSPADINLTVDAMGGQFMGSAPDNVGTHTFTGRVRDGANATVTNTVTVRVKDPDPPVTRTICVGAEFTGRPGQAFSTIVSCGTDNAPLTLNPSTSPPWTGATWTKASVLQGKDTWRFSTTIPTGTPLGLYNFDANVLDAKGELTLVRVAVTVGAPPLTIHPTYLAIQGYTGRAFSREIVVTGGPPGAKFFSKVSGLPSWLRIDGLTGQQSFTARTSPSNGTGTFRVTVGATSKDFALHWNILRQDGGTPFDEDE